MTIDTAILATGSIAGTALFAAKMVTRKIRSIRQTRIARRNAIANMADLILFAIAITEQIDANNQARYEIWDMELNPGLALRDQIFA